MGRKESNHPLWMRIWGAHASDVNVCGELRTHSSTNIPNPYAQSPIHPTQCSHSAPQLVPHIQHRWAPSAEHREVMVCPIGPAML